MKTTTPKLSRLYNILVYVFLYAPILVLIIFSFNESKNRAVWTGFTLHWYADLLHNDAIIDAFITTLSVAVLAALISTVFGTLAAIGFFSMKRRPRSICMSINNIPMTNAEIITGVSLMLLFVFSTQLLNGLVYWIGKMCIRDSLWVVCALIRSMTTNSSDSATTLCAVRPAAAYFWRNCCAQKDISQKTNTQNKNGSLHQKQLPFSFSASIKTAKAIFLWLWPFRLLPACILNLVLFIAAHQFHQDILCVTAVVQNLIGTF